MWFSLTYVKRIILDKSADDVRLAIEKTIEHNNRNQSNSRIFLNATYSTVNMEDSLKLSEASGHQPGKQDDGKGANGDIKKVVFSVSHAESGSRFCTQLDIGVFVLFGGSTSLSYNTIQSYSQALNVPYVIYSTSRNAPADGYTFDITLSPSYIEAIIDIIKYFSWKKVYYLFDSDDGLWQLQKLYDAFRDPSFNLVVDARRLRTLDRSHEVLRRLDRSDPDDKKRIIVSLTNVDAYQIFLNQIVDVGMNRENYHYIIGGPDIDILDLKSFIHGGVNITGFTLIPLSTHHLMTSPSSMASAPSSNKGKRRAKPRPLSVRVSTDAALAADGIRILIRAFNLLLDSPTNRQVYKAFRRGELYNNETKGIKCRAKNPKPWVHGEVIKDAIKQVNLINGYTGDVTFSSGGTRNNHSLNIMHLSYKQPLTKVGTWSKAIGITTNMTRPDQSQSKCPNRTRIVTTILESPFTMDRCLRDGTPCTGTPRYEGFCVDVARMVAEVVGFDYVLRLVKDGNYGGRQKDGSWNGMIGELMNDEADIAIAPLSIIQMRERVVDFSKPFMESGISIMIRKPEKQKPGVFSFMAPFSNTVWVCITVGFLAVSTILFLVGRFSPFEWNVDETGAEAQNSFNMRNTLWFTLGALMQQGSDISPRSMSGRIVGSAWWFFTLILISSYTANLAAFLTIERLVVPIDSADDLLKHPEIRYGTRENGSTFEFFKNSEVSVYAKMWNVMMDAVPSVFTRSVAEGIRRVQNSKGKYAYFIDSPMNEYQNQRLPCNTMKAGRNLDSKGYGIATPMGSDLRVPINIAVLELREIGELHRLKQKWWYDKGQCGAENSKDTKTSSLTLSNVSGIFYILVGGLVLAIIIRFTDYAFHTRCRKKTFKKTVQITVPGPDEDIVTSIRQAPAPGGNGAVRFPSNERELIYFEPDPDIENS
ncbi:glutamate receptor 2-like [Gigantopelta aegis]|uniref:glutamate receptor 2-like n=1 Tax=Gigantopelta aegis TaxID=1735272 RepID=UPI001B888F40|nr:glutamate receptor 2-like [Gigantopelta aegis]